MRIHIGLFILATALSCTTAAAQQRPRPPAPARNPISAVSKAPSTLVAPNPGSIEGFVYWDAGLISHNPAGSCTGLAVTVTAAGSSGAFAQEANNFRYAGEVKAFLSGGKVAVYDVCIYAYDHLPVGPDLQVRLTVTQPSAFSVPVVAQVPTVSQIKIINGQCNMLPKVVPSSLSDLAAHWGSCQNRAYDVNFALRPSSRLLSPGSGSRGLLSGSNTGGANSGSSDLGSSSPASRGMVNPGPVQSPPAGASGQMLSAQPGQQPLTNVDVIRMVKGGLPEQVILAKIQAAGKNFDFSPRSCQALAQAHISQKVLNAMGDGSVRPCFTGGVRTGSGADDLNPQPLPPHAGSALASSKAGPLRNRRVGVNLTVPKQGHKITNPKAASQNAAIIAVLQEQRRFADADVAQMKLGIRQGSTQLQPSTTMSANGKTMLGASAAQTRANNGNLASTATPASQYATLPKGMNPGLALQCGHDPSLRILAVNGGPHPTIFTQDDKYNFFTITGCSFGDPGPNSKAYIYYQGTFHEDLQIEEWSDNWIKLHLDPKLRGVDDQNDVTLVVQRGDGKQASKSGFRFYAARDTILLSQIPQQYFSLNRFRSDQAIIQSWKPTYTSGSSSSVLPNLPGLSAEVHWDLTTDAKGTIVSGSDIYDFSHLHSTFSLDSASMESVGLSCTDPNYLKFVTATNNWGIDWYGSSGVQVSWQGQMCDITPGSCGGAFQGDCFANTPESNYGINVWVTGPRGVDPWTGKPGS